MMTILWVLAPRRLAGRCQHFGETYSLHLKAEVAVLRTGRIYLGLEGGKAEGVGQSGIRNEWEAVPGQQGVSKQASEGEGLGRL
jgi:hypothetical protein